MWCVSSNSSFLTLAIIIFSQWSFYPTIDRQHMKRGNFIPGGGVLVLLKLTDANSIANFVWLPEFEFLPFRNIYLPPLGYKLIMLWITNVNICTQCIGCPFLCRINLVQRSFLYPPRETVCPKILNCMMYKAFSVVFKCIVWYTIIFLIVNFKLCTNLKWKLPSFWNSE